MSAEASIVERFDRVELAIVRHAVGERVVGEIDVDDPRDMLAAVFVTPRLLHGVRDQIEERVTRMLVLRDEYEGLRREAGTLLALEGEIADVGLAAARRASRLLENVSRELAAQLREDWGPWIPLSWPDDGPREADRNDRDDEGDPEP